MTVDEAPDDGREWQRRITRTVAGELRRYRECRGWSAQRLADECAALGFAVARSTLAGLETGRRETIAVHELLVIARALDVAPIALIAPVGPHVEGVEDAPGSVEVSPGVRLDVDEALAWLDGSTAATGHESLAAVREHGRLVDEWQHFRSRLARVRALPAADQTDELGFSEVRQGEATVRDLERQLAAHRAQMRARGETPPGLPGVLAVLVDPDQGGGKKMDQDG